MNHTTALIVSLATLTFAACEAVPIDESAAPESQAEPVSAALPQSVTPPPPASAVEALNAYYATIDRSSLPVAPAGPALPDASQPITRILIGSCNNEERDSPTLARTAVEPADLFIMTGDNVYGDSDDTRGRVFNEPDFEEHRESFVDLAASPEFQAVRASHPMMVAWDDHDYGANDAGADFPFKVYAEMIHETFWGLDDEDVGSWPGTYYARSFGPEGQRTQIIMLDTRFFRGPLVNTDQWNAPGKQRYIPHTDPMQQDMLGAAQWTWLENQLREPADLRLIVSSIQISTTDGHGYEHWNNMPAERDRLFQLIDRTDAEGVVFVSGDRHTGFLYRLEDDLLPYPVHEVTASSLNMSFADESSETDRAQLGAGFAKTHFGAINMDWDARTVSLTLNDETGEVVRNVSFPIPPAP
ncbi:MAG: alkaline phosphatase D family protein [Pseudomonadota bacterium]